MWYGFGLYLASHMQPGNLLSRTAALCSLGGYLGKGGTWVIITGLLDEDEPLLARYSHPISALIFHNVIGYAWLPSLRQ